MSELNPNIPETGISGLYEVIMGAAKDSDHNGAYWCKYFGEFGFSLVKQAKLSASEASKLYGVPSGCNSYRLQNGDIDSHGLVRILEWDQPIGPGVGYVPPRTIGSRIAVMRTKDIFRINDVYNGLREAGQKWNPTQPVADDLFGLNSAEKDFFKRPVIVRENAVYGEYFSHIFFQRYGYYIDGYGTIGDQSPLQTSEFTHHDFFVNASSIEEMNYMETVLGMHGEDPAKIDSDAQIGPREVFQMAPGTGHWYRGYVSPNNICGKLKFFVPTTRQPDKSDRQRVGELGITLHSFYSSKLDLIYDLATDHGFDCSDKIENEFGERSFVFSALGGCTWQIIDSPNIKHQPKTKLEFTLTKD